MNKKGKGTIGLVLLLSVLLSCCLSVGALEDECVGASLVYGDEEIEYAARVGVIEDSGGGEIGSDTVLGSRLWELLAGSGAADVGGERPALIVGGGVFGTRIKEAHPTVTAGDEGGNLKEGDKIISINGKTVTKVSDIKDILKNCDGSEISICTRRAGKTLTVKYAPKLVGGEYRLGAVLREGAAGIGTVTYIDPESGEFGGLGHGICDAESGDIIEMSGGTVTGVILGGVVRGEAGKPGELSGILTDRPMGEIYANTDSGVFGKLSSIPSKSGATCLPIAYRSEVKAGAATIRSTLKNGLTMDYKVELSDVKTSATGTKCFRIKVTDPTLLAISGGIVRGMSGSPIIQDGKLVGAVTHVLVDDPCSGYGIFIENMLEAARQNTMPKAA